MADTMKTTDWGRFSNDAVIRRESHPERRVARSPSGRIADAFTASPAQHDGTLPAALAERISGEVRFDKGARALYATDASNYRQVPIGVVIPREIEDVIAAMAVCREHGAPFLSRGGGTSLAGQCCNTAVIADNSKYLNRVLEIDPERCLARVEPGAVLDDLRDAAELHGLTFGPDPSTHDHNTLGGMLGNNSCGVHSVMSGRTADNVHTLDILTYDGLRMTVGETSEAELRSIIAGGGRRGDIYRRLDALRWKYADLIRRRYPNIPRRVSGYNLDNLLPENGFHVARALVGSEGTCVAILGATLRLVPSPPARVLAVLGYPDVFQAGDAVPRVLEHGPIGLEGIDRELIEFMKVKHLRAEDVALLPEGGGWLLVELGGDTKSEAVDKAAALMDAIGSAPHPPVMKLFDDREQQERIWKVRRSGLGGTAFVPHHPDTWEGWEDSAVAPDKVGAYLRDLKGLFGKYSYDSALYGHFGDGCIHCRINFGLRDEKGIAAWRSFLEEAADLVTRYGGSISGEHGDGQSKAELLDKMYGPELLDAFREFKTIWDPEWKMNPGKVVDPYPITSNLRVGPEYHPPHPKTHFSFPEDHGSFAHAALRCVGVGECRRHNEEGVMCPSYKATREEMYATRGRARLLFEMLHRGVLEQGWRSPNVEEALDLCLACKGCKSDCPVNVDMATYKAEFRAHHYAGRLRPRAFYSMGQIHVWARVLKPVAGGVNLLLRTPGINRIPKWLAGIHPARTPPAFAAHTFRSEFRPRRDDDADGPLVVLWTDSFNNYFTPAPLHAAAEVLRAAGCRVEIPPTNLCCGRPLFDYGFLGQAKRTLRRTVRGLKAQIDRGAYVVGVEPSCMGTFRDELTALLPGDEGARRLHDRSMLFAEFLEKVLNYAPPQVRRKAVVRAHCHHKAIFGVDHDKALLRKAGVAFDFLQDGCCGMAGAFGYETRKYDVSMKIAEQGTLPAVRAADSATLLVCDGFSCREQILQATCRPVLTLPEVLQQALHVRVGAETTRKGTAL